MGKQPYLVIRTAGWIGGMHGRLESRCVNYTLYDKMIMVVGIRRWKMEISSATTKYGGARRTCDCTGMRITYEGWGSCFSAAGRRGFTRPHGDDSWNHVTRTTPEMNT
uniref:Uncharacterized protein n=1 Tax=Aegilops tauschii TaxID=37682 RepID=M8BQ42_AEGTA